MASQFDREIRSAVAPLTSAELLARGIKRPEWRGKGWRTTARGLFVPSDAPVTTTQRIVEAAALVPPGGALAGWAAAFVHGVDFLDGLDHETREPLPVPICLNSPSGRTNPPGVTYFRDRLGPSDATLVAGIPVLTVTRTAIDGARHAPVFVEAVVFLDAMAHALSHELDLSEVRRWCGAHAGDRRVLRVRNALTWVDAASASPWETRLRMFYRLTVKLPRPRVNVPVFDLDERFLGTPDLLDVDAGLACEFDGQDHRVRRQHREDNLREERLEAANLTVCRVDSLDLRYLVPLQERLQAAYARGRSRNRALDRFTTRQPDWWQRRRGA